MCSPDGDHYRPRRERPLLERWLDGTTTATRLFFTSREPWHRRIVLAARNLWIRIERQQDCCGHYGEPGC